MHICTHNLCACMPTYTRNSTTLQMQSQTGGESMFLAGWLQNTCALSCAVREITFRQKTCCLLREGAKKEAFPQEPTREGGEAVPGTVWEKSVSCVSSVAQPWAVFPWAGGEARTEWVEGWEVKTWCGQQLDLLICLASEGPRRWGLLRLRERDNIFLKDGRYTQKGKNLWDEETEED